ncbi:MAG: hypothetical protein KDA24_08740 [Deltaproteobacteria bacterium]|nr:hypothetical protein [Deltaproteobacteria bacterium]
MSSTVSRALLMLLLVFSTGCSVRGDDDDDASDDDDDDSAVADDDDSASDDDDAANDDDAADDDDATGSATAPVVENVDVCDTQIVGTEYLRFSIEISDPDGDLLAPIRYYLQYDNVETGGASPLLNFTVEQDMFSGGTITHLLRVGEDGIDRGVGYEFSWYVLDAAAQPSNTYVEGYFINSVAGNDDC